MFVFAELETESHFRRYGLGKSLGTVSRAFCTCGTSRARFGSRASWGRTGARPRSAAPGLLPANSLEAISPFEQISLTRCTNAVPQAVRLSLLPRDLQVKRETVPRQFVSALVLGRLGQKVRRLHLHVHNIRNIHRRRLNTQQIQKRSFHSKTINNSITSCFAYFVPSNSILTLTRPDPSTRHSFPETPTHFLELAKTD